MNIRKDSGPVKWIMIAICALFLGVMLVLPLIYVLFTAFEKGISVFWKAVSDEYALKSIFLTIEVTVITVLINTVFGLFASWCITRFQFKGKKVISTLIDLPLTISPIIAGLIYVLTFGRQSILYPYLQGAGIKIIFAVPGIVLATIFVTFPFISTVIPAILEAILSYLLFPDSDAIKNGRWNRSTLHVHNHSLPSVEVLLGCDCGIFHTVVSLLRPDVQHKTDREMVEIRNGNPDLHTPQ